MEDQVKWLLESENYFPFLAILCKSVLPKKNIYIIEIYMYLEGKLVEEIWYKHSKKIK